MTDKQLLAACRVQVALMLLDYHQEVETALRELVRVLPARGSNQGPYHVVLRHFTASVKALEDKWT